MYCNERTCPIQTRLVDKFDACEHIHEARANLNLLYVLISNILPLPSHCIHKLHELKSSQSKVKIFILQSIFMLSGKDTCSRGREWPRERAAFSIDGPDEGEGSPHSEGGYDAPDQTVFDLTMDYR